MLDSEASDTADSAESDGELEDELSAELAGAAWVSCPYCGESVELLVDPAGGSDQAYVEDCEVCCRPWSVRVSVDSFGHPTASVTTLDDE